MISNSLTVFEDITVEYIISGQSSLVVDNLKIYDKRSFIYPQIESIIDSHIDLQPEDTLEEVVLYYKYNLSEYETNDYEQFSIEIYNYMTSEWDVISSTPSILPYFDIFSCSLTDHINIYNNLQFRIVAKAGFLEDQFNLTLDLFYLECSYTKISGEIDATLEDIISIPFLDQYNYLSEYQ